MLPFGLFTSIIPYVVAALLYVMYLGTYACQKHTSKENAKSQAEKRIVVKQAEKKVTSNVYHYFDFFLPKYTTKNKICHHTVTPFIFNFILRNGPHTYTPLFSRPPPFVSNTQSA